MSPDTETELDRSKDAEDALEAQGDELETRVGALEERIDDAKTGLRARKDDADAEDSDDDDDSDDDPLAFDDPEADEEEEDD
jgi:hypothetical protein